MSPYLKDLAERVVSSFVGGALSVIGLSGVDAFHLDWKAALGVGGGAALVSLLKGLVARGVGDPGTASLLPVASTALPPIVAPPVTLPAPIDPAA
jgi:hypothetical protein